MSSDPVLKQGQVREASFCGTDLHILFADARVRFFLQASSSCLPSEGQYWPQPRSFEFLLVNSISVWGAGITQQFSASHVNP